jgi:hypothetical protein
MSWKPADAFKDIARGDRNAEEFMGALYIWFHKQDDLIDRDKAVPADVTAGFDFHILSTFAGNLFFQTHKDFLLPVLMVGALAWVASEDRRTSEDVLERITGQVLKSQYGDIFFTVAFLRGGFDHAVAMSRRYREYSFDDEKPSNLRLAFSEENMHN